MIMNQNNRTKRILALALQEHQEEEIFQDSGSEYIPDRGKLNTVM